MSSREDGANAQIKQQLVNHPSYVQALEESKQRPRVGIALTQMCNFGCSYCATSRKTSKPKSMDLHLLKSILEDCKAWGVEPGFGQTYEVFLHPQIDEVIKTVNSYGWRFKTATNGSVLTRKVYDLPMDLDISINENAAEFEFRDAGMDFDRYLERLIEFLRYRMEHRIPGKMKFQTADYTLLEKGYNGYDQEIHSVEHIKQVMRSFTEMLGCEIGLSDAELTEYVEHGKHIVIFDQGECQLYFYSHKIMPGTYEMLFGGLDELPAADEGYCDSAYTMVSVQADGGLAYCCSDPSAKTVFHYLTPDESLREVWFSDEFEEVRQAFRNRKPKNSFCNQCLYNVSENTKPLLSKLKPKLVGRILNELGVEADLNWYQFPKETSSQTS